MYRIRALSTSNCSIRFIFAVISCLETQPQTVRKLLFAKEYFRDVYMLLNDADRMFADILISDCAGCVKLLKSLQKEVEEKA